MRTKNARRRIPAKPECLNPPPLHSYRTRGCEVDRLGVDGVWASRPWADVGPGGVRSTGSARAVWASRPWSEDSMKRLRSMWPPSRRWRVQKKRKRLSSRW
jgi:hypothetical protein